MSGMRADYHRNATIVTSQIIQQCFLEDNREHNKKQHHTAKRIYDRLVAEMHFTGSESSIRHTVQKLREVSQNVFVPLVFSPSEAMQIDWGERYLCVSKRQAHEDLLLLCKTLLQLRSFYRLLPSAKY